MQLLGQLPRPLCLLAAPARQEQVAGTVALYEVTGDEGAEGAGAAADQNGLLWVYRPGQVENDLADVLALPEIAEGLWGRLHLPGGNRGMAKNPALEKAQQLYEHFLRALEARFDYIKGPVDDSGALSSDLIPIANVGLAHLQEAPT